MATPKTLHDVFVDELKDSYDHEKQLIKALRKMSSVAYDAELKAAFTSHLAETQDQVSVLEKVFAQLDMKPKGKHCAGIAGIIEEGSESIEDIGKSPLLDAAMIGGGKRAEHYEISAYEALIAMATELGYNDSAKLVQGILDQEVACDQKLNQLAKKLMPLAHAAEADAGARGAGRTNGTAKKAASKSPSRSASKSGAKKKTASR